MPPQCDCSHDFPCPDDKPTPCDELKELAKKCQHDCPPCGESFDRLPPPCPEGLALAREEQTPERLDQRSVQQGAISEAARRQAREEAASAATPSGAGPGVKQGATPEELDRRSVQQGGTPDADRKGGER